jgi:hypothetical protein
MEQEFALKWGMTRRSVRRYVVKAKEDIRDQLDEQAHTREERLRMFRSRLNAAQRRMYEAGEWGAWIRSMQLEAQLTLDDKAGQHDGEAYRPLTDAEKARIAELATRH